MAMKFTYKVSGVKVYSETGKADIIKEATLHIIGAEGGETFDEAQVIKWLTKTHGKKHIDAMKEGMASMYNNPNNPTNNSRANPQEKELV